MHETSTHLSHQQLRVEKKILNYSITEEAVMHDEKRDELVNCHEENRTHRLWYLISVDCEKLFKTLR
jgi:hypothetical protein